MTLQNTPPRALPTPHTQTLEDYLIYLKHLALYKFVASYTARKRVLDLGCGEGYGSDALAHTARLIVAADRDAAGIGRARQKYTRANLAFVVCDAQALPFRAASFEAVVSFGMIAHIPNARKYLEEIKRVNAAAGVAIISTPNRVLRLLPFQQLWHRSCLREYAARDLARVVGAVFPRTQLCGITATSAVLEIEKRRVRPSSFVAYPKMLAHMIVPTSWLNQIKARLPRPAAARAEPFDATKFAVDDFSVVDDGSATWLNLIAISR
ncbi:MAG: class I SAM-dependent methyltransferase [Chloroflexota bacterium]